MENAPRYEERIVAFVDILGFGALVSSIGHQPEVHGRIHFALKNIRSYKEHSLRNNTAHSELEVSVFSDSIAISSEATNVFDVIWACGWLQAQLLLIGILTRGGISVGRTFHESDILYGEGVLQAYNLESSAAIYPRILIDPLILNRIDRGIKTKFLAEDSDGLWFVDPFKFDATVGGAEELAADGYDPREIYFEELEGHIRQGIEGSKLANHLSKWKWLEKRHQIALEQHIRTR